MNVKELLEALATLPPDTEVILQKDSEGNGYSPCSGADPEAVYVPDSTYSGTVYSAHRPADEHCLAQAQSCVPAGWKLVPIDPTETMYVAGDDAVAECKRNKCAPAGDTYRAMLAASPQPQPVQPSERTPPERDSTKPAEQQGVFRKFDVQRVDGSSAPGGKHHGCEYFVLDVDHDPIARTALSAYADAVEATHPVLAADMRGRYSLTVAQAKPEQPFLNCTCFNETDRMYCTSKGKCSRIVAAAAPQPKD